jgi:hypothetical protein
MGRKKKYFTEEDAKIAKRIKALKYYYKNKERINKERMEAYYGRKNIDKTVPKM